MSRDTVEVTGAELNNLLGQIQEAEKERNMHARVCVSFVLCDLPDQAAEAARKSRDAAQRIEALWERMRDASPEVVS